MKLALLGDIALFGRCSSKSNSDIESYFGDVSELLGNYDLVVGNLETPFSRKKRTSGAKSAYICADDVDVRLLTLLNIDALCLANNHMYDYGVEGVTLTKRLLELHKIDYFGLDGKDWRYQDGTNRIAFTGCCCYSTNPLRTVPYGKEGVNEFNVARVSEILSENSKDGFLNILSVHAGIEHVNYPSYDTIAAARKFADVAPYIYYGHHPHVAQAVESYRGSLIAYSLGNFCFDDVYSSVSGDEPLVKLTENNRSSFILEIEIVENQIVSYNTIPIYIGKDKLHVGRGVQEDKLREYADAINRMSRLEYEQMRNKIIADRIAERASKRDIKWVIKRLRLRYVELLITNFINRRKYKACVSSKL